MPADMSESVKQKELIPCPCFSRGFSFNKQGISYCKDLLSIEGCEWFLKVQDCQWMLCQILYDKTVDCDK
jgi:hypothetical protein